MYVYIYIYMYIQIYIYIYIYIYTHIHMAARERRLASDRDRVGPQLLDERLAMLCIYIYIYTHIHTHIHIYIYVFLFLTQRVFPTSTWCLLRRWTGDPPETLSGLTSNPLSFSIRLSDRRQDLNSGPPPPELSL